MQEYDAADAELRPPGVAAVMMCRAEPAEIKLAAAFFEANTGRRTAWLETRQSLASHSVALAKVQPVDFL
jgi:hypothetical protein